MTLDSKDFLKALAAELRAEIVDEERHLLAAAKRMQARAKQLVPVDEGQLRDAIKVKEGRLSRKGYYVEVGVDSREASHALPVEYGTHKTPPRSFMRVAVAEVGTTL